MTVEVCVVCGGDGRLSNSFGNEARCPACHGTGRRAESGGMRDVTKTKPSHHRPKVAPALKSTANAALPTTAEGVQLTAEVKACATISTSTRDRLTQEIRDYEVSHGHCTQTFSRKIRRQLRAPT